MRLLVTIPTVFLGVTSFGQITLEHTYLQGSSMMLGYADPSRQFFMVNLEELGHTYVMVDRVNKVVNFYDLSHAPIGAISFAGGVVLNENVASDILYLSQHLFDLDDGVEFLYGNYYFDGSVVQGITQVFDDDGSVVFSANGAPLVKPNYHQQHFPIYATSQGTKLILSMANGDANVYSLAGTFTAGMTGVTQELTGFPFPNPTTSELYLPYTLPAGETNGIMEILGATGNIVRSLTVTNSESVLHLNTGTLASGTYLYRIRTASGILHGQRFLVAK